MVTYTNGAFTTELSKEDFVKLMNRIKKQAKRRKMLKKTSLGKEILRNEERN